MVFRNATLTHLLWVLVLVKLITPPLLEVPVSIQASRIQVLSDLPTAVGNLFYKPIADQKIYDELVPSSTATKSASDANLMSLGKALGAGTTSQPTETDSAASVTLLDTLIALAIYSWCAGSILYAAWILSSSLRLHYLIEHRGRLDSKATRDSVKIASATGGASPPVWLVDAVISPMLVGFGTRARIAFPEVLWLSLDEQARKALLLHELEHHRRRDPLVRYIEAIAIVLFWWHPLVWITRIQIEDCEERCCDLATTATSEISPRTYANAILSTLDFLAEPSRWYQQSLGTRPIASGVGPIFRIEHRVRQILSLRGGDSTGRRFSDQVESRLREIMSSSETPRPGMAMRIAMGAGCITVLLLYPAIHWTESHTINRHRSLGDMPHHQTSRQATRESHSRPSMTEHSLIRLGNERSIDHPHSHAFGSSD